MTSFRDIHYCRCIFICIYAFSVGFVTTCDTSTHASDGTSAPPETLKSSSTLNNYCDYSVQDPPDPKYHFVRIKCKNDPNSVLAENVYNADKQNTYFQADNGAMSRAVEDAIKQITTKYPHGTRQIQMHVDGKHPLGDTHIYGRLVAMIDISNKLATGLGGNDSVQLTVLQAGLRVDPQFSADLVRVMPLDGVILVNWNYKKRRNPGS